MRTLEEAYYSDKQDMMRVLNYEWLIRNTMKAAIIFHVEFVRGEDVDEKRYEVCFRERMALISQPGDIEKMMSSARKYAQMRIDTFISQGTGWIMEEVIFTDLEIGTCGMLTGGCGLLDITYPSTLDKIKVPRSSNNQCFLEAVALYFVKSGGYKKIRQFIRDKLVVNIQMPAKVRDIAKFENDNKKLKFRISLIYSEDSNTIYPMYCSRRLDARHHITLLLYRTTLNDKVVNHYCLISDVETFLRKRYVSEEGKVSYGKPGARCLNCFAKFTSRYGKEQEMLKEHMQGCLANKPQAIEMPSPGINDVLKFKNFNKRYKTYLWGVFDFETACVPAKTKCRTCSRHGSEANCQHRTTIYAEQVPITYSLIILNFFNEVLYKSTYSGQNDCVEHMLNFLLDIEEDLLALLQKYPTFDRSRMTASEKKALKEATHCDICGELLGGDVVVDHCHATNVLLGFCHSECNLHRVQCTKIPLFAHNMTSFDGHFVLKKLGAVDGITNIQALPLNTEKMRTVSFNSYTLLDSYSFLTTSLQNLMSELASDKKHPWAILDQLGLYDKNDKELKKLLLQKGVFPYEYAKDLETLRTTTRMVEKKHFFSTLRNENISDEEHAHAVNVFEKFGCGNLQNYCELYCQVRKKLWSNVIATSCAVIFLQVDVAGLAECLSVFKEEIWNSFHLEICRYISTSQLAMDAFLSSTGVHIQLLTNPTTYNWVESAIKGGLSFINERYAEAGYNATTKEYTRLYLLDMVIICHMHIHISC